MLDKLRRILGNAGFFSFAASLISIVCGLLVGLIIMFIFNPKSALDGFTVMLRGGFADGLRGIGNVLYYTTPFIMVGLSVAFSFQTGVFNIGVAGQFTAGSFAAIFIVSKFTGIPGPLQWIAGILAAGLVGMLWGVIPGILKSNFNINEIISCIMMNYIAMYLVNQLVKDFLYDPSLVGSKYIPISAIMPKVGLDKLFPGSTVNLGFFIAVLFSAGIYVLLYKTGFGYELRACGFNRFAAHYAGINEKRNIVAVMLIAGFVAGVGGGILHLSSTSKYYKISEVFLKEANYGIPIALLGANHPIGVIFAAVFIAYITIGGSLMQGNGFPIETVDMITAVIIYFAAFSLVFRQFFEKLLLPKNKKSKEKDKRGGI